MKRINQGIASWIKPYVTIIGDLNNTHESLRKTNPTKFYVKSTIPECFEKYAISLHSYWINYNIPKEQIKIMENADKELAEEDFTRITWEDFYLEKGINFDLEKAITDSVNWKYPSEQLTNELLPSEGSIDLEHLKSFSKRIHSLYGDQEIEVFFHLCTTKRMNDSLLFEGRISQLLELLKQDELFLTPSLIYAKDKSWVINTDIDLSFSTIGGESKLINQLIENHNKEIYEVTT